MRAIAMNYRFINFKRAGLFAVVILFIAAIHFQIVGAASTFAPYQYNLVTATADGNGILTNSTGSTGVNGVSEDGNKILFTTPSSNFPNNTAGQWAGFLRDMSSATTVRVDLTPSGTAPNQQSGHFVMNTTGRYVAFSSTASDIVTTPSTSSSIRRIYLKDMQTNTTELITDISGPSTSGDNSLRPVSVSDDGRYIVVQTANINKLIPGTRSGSPVIADVLLYDRANQTWTIINKTHTGSMPSVDVYAAGSSCDSSLALLQSQATDLVASHSGSASHTFLADIRNGLRITDITAGATGDSSSANISCNGRYVTYATTDRTLLTTPTGMNSTSYQAVRYDRLTGERKYIGSLSNNTTYNSYSSTPYSVTDAGDALIVLGGNHIFYDYKIYFKHLSDGSGTLEDIAMNNNAYLASFRISSNNKYVVTSTQAAYNMGLPVQYVSGSDLPRNIVRVKTGL